MITPQAIKDQEFQLKFRGYDAIEVRAYLDLLADDVFELTEKNRVQAEEIETLMAEQEALHREKETLSQEIQEKQEDSAGMQTEIDQGYQQKDEEISELKATLAEVQAQLAALQEENEGYRQKINELETEQQNKTGDSLQDLAELEKLRGKIAFLEEQNSELKQEGLDFKTTILAAQKFADNLRQTTEEEARRMIEAAAAEIDQIRTDAQAELERYPIEIAELKARKQKVQEDVRRLLQTYLDGLSVFNEDSSLEDADLDDLFQSIQLPDDTLQVEDEGVGEEHEPDHQSSGD
jgi:DivIVA domain-containing protein